jgi:hypothetical protein
MDKTIRSILTIMEDNFDAGRTPMSGAIMAQMEVDTDMRDTSKPHSTGYDVEPEKPEYTELEYKIAKRFIVLVGGVERARDIINKCDECAECLNLMSDEEMDAQTIDQVADMVPDDVDMPTVRNVSTLYNPSAVTNQV